MPFQPHRAHATRNGITVDITRAPTGEALTVTVVRLSRQAGGNGRLVRRHYASAPVHEVTSLIHPHFTSTTLLTPAQILSIDIHRPKYIYEILDRGVVGILFQLISHAPAINGRRHCVLLTWTRA